MTELSEDIEVLTPGQILSEGRREVGLTQQDVAEQLNLRIGVIEALEADQIDSSLSLTFTKGYLRSYARLLGLSEQEVLDSFHALADSQVQVAEMQSFSQKVQRDQQESRLLVISMVILLLIAASLVAWWWQQHKATQPELYHPPVTQLEPQSEVVESVAKTEQLDTEASTETLPDAASSNEREPDRQLIEQAAETVEVQQLQPAAEPVAESVQLDAPAENLLPEPTADSGLTALVLTFSADCWVEIFDSTGSRLAVGVKKAGRVMPVEGVPPFKLKLGVPSVVAIEYAGKAYPFEVASPGQMLRLTIPE